MNVEDVGHAEKFRRLDNGAAKKREALGVIGIIDAGSAVKLLAIKEFRTIDKVILHAVALASVDDADKTVVGS